MLVLARQLNERIIMPTVAATIEVVAIKPGGVRLGIEAPPEITILREEVFHRGGMTPATPLATIESEAALRLAQVRHVLRNRLHTVALGLEVVRQQLPPERGSGPQAMLQRMENEIRTLDRQLRALLADACLETVHDGLAI